MTNEEYEKIKAIIEEAQTHETWFQNEDGSEYEDKYFDESWALEEIKKLCS
jgi:hypothetical protein